MAQTVDLKNWLNIAYETEVIDDLKFSAEQELRLNQTPFKFGSTLTEIGLSYKIAKFFKVGGGYRISFSPGKFENRFFGGFTFRYKPNKDLQFNFRTRYQTEFSKFNFTTHALREKVSFKYLDFKDWRPFVYIETWLHMQYNFRNFNRYRAGVGTEIDLKKGHDLCVALFYQQEFNVESPNKSLTLSIGYLFNK